MSDTMSIHIDLLARNMDRGMSIQQDTNDWNTIRELIDFYSKKEKSQKEWKDAFPKPKDEAS